jgi:hypothetical protein
MVLGRHGNSGSQAENTHRGVAFRQLAAPEYNQFDGPRTHDLLFEGFHLPLPLLQKARRERHRAMPRGITLRQPRPGSQLHRYHRQALGRKYALALDQFPHDRRRKPNRHRDTEFEDAPKTRAELFAMWEAGWKVFLETLESLSDSDMNATVVIRSEPHSVMQAINRQLAHYPMHLGQIVLLAKHYAGGNWKTLSVPRKASAQFTADVVAGRKSQR